MLNIKLCDSPTKATRFVMHCHKVRQALWGENLRASPKLYEGQKLDGASRGVPAEGVAQDHPKKSISDAFCAAVKRLA
ncbi:MAG: hypothetical protein WC966_11425 [Bradymonadales bacterium]